MAKQKKNFKYHYLCLETDTLFRVNPYVRLGRIWGKNSAAFRYLIKMYHIVKLEDLPVWAQILSLGKPYKEYLDE